MFRRILCILGLLAFASCALPRQINSPETVANIKSVILITAVEEKLTLSYIGMTVFNNAKYEVPVDWNFNDLLREKMIKALAGRYEIRSFAYDPKAFSGAYNSNDATLGTANHTTKLLKQNMQPGLADAIIVVVSASSAHYGARWARGSTIGTNYTMNVYDGGTLEPIAQAYGGIACRRPICFNGYDYMAQPASFRWSGGDPASSIQAAQRDEIRMTAESLLIESVPNTLGRLGLIARPDKP